MCMPSNDSPPMDLWTHRIFRSKAVAHCIHVLIIIVIGVFG